MVDEKTLTLKVKKKNGKYKFLKQLHIISCHQGIEKDMLPPLSVIYNSTWHHLVNLEGFT